jgi:DNA polymerase-3 subunit gamma/tau
MDLSTPGVHDASIAESRHPDVIEMDAASRTGINDIREIIEGVRYAPVSARYKVYIIDEVHMLSTAAFNGLLKTLEEPPPHVKFIFATTEVRKVPVTVLSRCQRFDLKRIEVPALMGLLNKICAAEKVEAEEGALRLIARAAEGSARDSLSILDQAMAQSAGKIEESAVRDMLGLADRTRTLELLERLLAGDIAKSLAMMKEQTDAGADSLAILQDLAALVHQATKTKILNGETDEAASGTERKTLAAIAGGASLAGLNRYWQMLLKGIGEVQTAGDAIAAAEMVLIRLAYVADLPSPEELVRRLDGSAKPAGNAAPAASRPAPVATAPAAPSRAPVSVAQQPRAQAAPRLEAMPQPSGAPQALSRYQRFEDFIADADARKEIRLARELKDDVHLIRFEPGLLEFEPGPRATPDLAARAKRALQDWTGATWMVSLAKGEGAAAPNIRTQMIAADKQRKMEASAEPLVKAILETFPGAKIVDVRDVLAPAASGLGDAPETVPDENDDWDDLT